VDAILPLGLLGLHTSRLLADRVRNHSYNKAYLYYDYSNQITRGVKGCGNSYRVLGKTAESWIEDLVADLACDRLI
jgi:hypothetical protein